MFRRLAFFAIALTFGSSPARAWDPMGHMLVGQIAYDQLTPAAKTNFDAALARFNAGDAPHDAPYDPVTAPCWMDDIRARPDTKPFAVWHYVNLPFTPDGRPPPADSAGPNVIWGVQRMVAILSGKESDPAIDRDKAMVILLHLVGDIHQPLHTTSRGDDAGGNKVKLANLKDPLADLIFSKGGNLHFFWDSAYRRVYRNGSATVLYEAPLHDRLKPVGGHLAIEPTIRTEATSLEKKYPRARFHEQGDALSWANESHGYGYILGYQKLPPGDPVKLTASYVNAARACAEERVALAGYRLGNLLNELLSAPATTPTPTPTPAPVATPDSANQPTPSPTPTRLMLVTPAVENPAP